MSGMEVLRAIQKLDAAMAESRHKFPDTVLNAIADLKHGFLGEMQFAVISSDGEWLWVGDGFEEAVTALNNVVDKRSAAALVQVITVSGELSSARRLIK